MSAAGESYWSQLPLGRGVQLIRRDANGLAAFAKPAGLLSHPNNAADEARSLLISAYRTEGEYFEWKGNAPATKPQRLYLLNRLDSATSGVILAASTEELAREIRALFQRRHIHKIYHALVFGVPGAPHQVWKDLLAVEKRAGKIRSQAVAGNIPAESLMKVVSTRRAEQALAVISLEPKTGRSHQLRVQCAKRHLPIVGDATYGDFSANREFAKRTGEKRLFLHSLETHFEYEYRGKKFKFSARAELPAEFSK